MRHTCVLWYVDDGDWCVRAAATQAYTSISPGIKLSSTHARKKLRPLSINHLRSHRSVFIELKRMHAAALHQLFSLSILSSGHFSHTMRSSTFCFYNVSGEDTAGTSAGHYTPLRDHYFCWHETRRIGGRQGYMPASCVGEALSELIFSSIFFIVKFGQHHV
jgi:hypothetical protein